MQHELVMNAFGARRTGMPIRERARAPVTRCEWSRRFGEEQCSHQPPRYGNGALCATSSTATDRRVRDAAAEIAVLRLSWCGTSSLSSSVSQTFSCGNVGCTAKVVAPPVRVAVLAARENQPFDRHRRACGSSTAATADSRTNHTVSHRVDGLWIRWPSCRGLRSLHPISHQPPVSETSARSVVSSDIRPIPQTILHLVR